MTAAHIELPDTPVVNRPRRIIIGSDGIARKVGIPHFTSSNASAAQTALYDHDTEYDRIIPKWSDEDKKNELRRWKKRRGEPTSLDPTPALQEPSNSTSPELSSLTPRKLVSPTPLESVPSSQQESLSLPQKQTPSSPAAVTTNKKRTAQDRLNSELSIDGTALLKSSDHGDVEAYEYDGKMYTFRGDEPEEWLTKRSKISPSKSRYDMKICKDNIS